MAEPKTEIERRLDALEESVSRLEQAINIMVHRLIASRAGFNANDAEAISKILRGEDEVKDATE